MWENSKRPLFSLITLWYNSEEYLERCLDSILNQNHTNIELIKINDSSAVWIILYK